MSLTQRPNMFANNPLDRAGYARTNPDWVIEQLDATPTLIMPIWQGIPLILPEANTGQGQGQGRDIAWLPKTTLNALLKPENMLIFLGLNRQGAPRFALDISPISSPETDPSIAPFVQAGAAFEELRTLALAADMPATELAIIAQAKGMVEWHHANPHCAKCGDQTTPTEGGYKRQCPSCDTEHFPRTDPVVIMLNLHEDKCLLGRQMAWPEGQFSALAGFMEPGETLEEAVARETMEEAGVRVAQMRYYSSQPWPFPASLMIGCHALAADTKITVDEKELAEAHWFSRKDIKTALDGKGDFMMPPPMAIAYHLIKAFADDEIHF